ncbi:MAG: hypothetical protein CM1200mP41_08030 [Gammaproteobacteria bacterium]|nr:MAG: hypothetical protein CM1200mP41_08030 [Gammaproteobacteria bacterium]
MKRTPGFAPKRSATCGSLLLFACAIGTTAKAATELEFQLTDGHGPRSLHVIVSKGDLRLQSSAQPGFELHFSAPTRTAYVINHPRRQYAHLDPTQLEKSGVAVSGLVGALQNQLSGLDDSRRNRVNDFLKGGRSWQTGHPNQERRTTSPDDDHQTTTGCRHPLP